MDIVHPIGIIIYCGQHRKLLGNGRQHFFSSSMSGLHYPVLPQKLICDVGFGHPVNQLSVLAR